VKGCKHGVLAKGPVRGHVLRRVLERLIKTERAIEARAPA